MIIYDAVDVRAIPAEATALLAYIDGHEPTLAACRARFPNASILTVTVTGASRATICDVESGDASPATAAKWVRAGLGTTVYSSLFTKPALDKALKGLAWNWYAANPTGVPHLVPGSVATQYAWPVHTGGDYDMSITNGTWPGISPPSHAIPVPSAPTEEQQMNAILVNGVVIVYAADPNGHLLEFSKLATGWSVNDVTAVIHNARPDTPPFTVAP